MARKLKFIAWDTKSHTLKRLGKVELLRGELTLDGYIVLQFTGHFDKIGQEIYENDILLSKGENRSMVVWDTHYNGWLLEQNGKTTPLTTGFVNTTTKLYNFYEKDCSSK